MMAHWCVREELSQTNRLRRSYYELLRDQLDDFIISYGLVDSLHSFGSKNIPYPFVEKRELKPRARIPDVEYESQNAFLVIFVEDSIPAGHKKFIRFIDVGKTTKTNLLRSKSLPLEGKFDRTQKYFDSVQFFDFLGMLLPLDYALLIQRDPARRVKDRYMLSHFHVRIDWPIAAAAEDMARSLRYISKELYERGDKHAEDLQKKFFEYYGLPVMAGGRRTAAIVAAQYLKQIPCISTIYVGSKESRAVLRISERGISKSILMKFTRDEMENMAKAHCLTLRTFKKVYTLSHNRQSSICIFQTSYAFTDQARPPDDGKLREIKPDLNWLRVNGQFLLPKPGARKYPPLPVNVIYS